jgi:hypothetical protein
VSVGAIPAVCYQALSLQQTTTNYLIIRKEGFYHEETRKRYKNANEERN